MQELQLFSIVSVIKSMQSDGGTQRNHQAIFVQFAHPEIGNSNKPLKVRARCIISIILLDVSVLCLLECEKTITQHLNPPM